MMIKVPIAIGIGVIALLVLCCLLWGVWKLRRSMRTEQIFPALKEILVESRKGLKKDVVRSFPIVKTIDLNVDTSSKLQCPICWLAFRDADIMRQLPHCDHIFHRHCIDPVLEKQIICPVCGTILTDSPRAPEELNGRSPRHRHCQIPLRSLYATSPESAKSVSTPSWVLVNRPVPLPRTAVENGSSSSDRFEIDLDPSDSLGSSGEAPLLKYLNATHDVEDWKDVDIDLEQKCIDISFTFGTDIPVEKRPPGTAQGVDSFSFSTGSFAFTGTDANGLHETTSDATPPVTNFRSQLRRSRGKESTSYTSFGSNSNPSTRFSRSSSRSSRSTNSSSDSSFNKFASWDYAHPHLEDVTECDATEHQPLTKPPHQCSFDVLPVITGTGSYASRDSRDLSPVSSHRNRAVEN